MRTVSPLGVSDVDWRNKNISIHLCELLALVHSLRVTVNALVNLINCTHLEVVLDSLLTYWELAYLDRHGIFSVIAKN